MTMTIDNYADSISGMVQEAIRKAFNSGFQYAQSLNLNDDDFVDLGLPSGTKWAKDFFEVTDVTPEGGYFSPIEAQKYSIPTEEQLEELEKNCRCIYKIDKTVLVGPNGNEISFCPNKIWDIEDDRSVTFRPALGFKDEGKCSFWVRPSDESNSIVGYIYSYPNNPRSIYIDTANAYPKAFRHQIRLVKCSNKII